MAWNLISTTGGELYRVNGSGRTELVVDTNIPFTDIAVAQDGRVYGITFNSMYRIDLETGQSEYLRALPSTTANAMDIAENGKVYIASFGSSYIHVLNSPTSSRYEVLGGTEGFRSEGDLEIVNGRLFLTTTSDTLAILRQGNGTLRDEVYHGVSETYGIAYDGSFHGYSGRYQFDLSPNVGGARNFDLLDISGTITGASAPDKGAIIGSKQADKLYAPWGGVDVMGKNGADIIKGSSNGDALFGGGGRDRIEGRDGKDEIFGGALNDTLKGGKGTDRISGGDGSDKIVGNDGADLIFGGAASDAMTGGGGADEFAFADGHTGKSDAARDVITDFSDRDVLNLRRMDANTDTGRDEAFKFSGTTAKANSVWYKTEGQITTINGDYDGDGEVDFRIELRGFTGIDADHFLL